MPNEREERVCRIRTSLCIQFFHKMHSSKVVYRVICHISHIDKQIPANIYLFKVNNRNTRKWCKICSKLTIETLERCQLVSKC